MILYFQSGKKFDIIKIKGFIVNKNNSLSRRTFIKASAGLTLAATNFNKAFAAGSETIRLGLIGSGGRGLYDTTNCLNSSPNVELVAMGDLFKDRLDGILNKLKQTLPDKIKVTPDTAFIGFDAYKKVLACDVDMVILTEPPHFRPIHLKAAIKAGKHVFMEKPVATDPVGFRSVIASSQLADEKGLTIVAGTQARRMANRMAIIKRIHDGHIGEIVSGQCFRLGGAMLGWGPKTRKSEWTDMEWQIRRWLFLNWLSGDFITEMHIHELDIVNWAMDAHPVSCIGTGGRQVRTDPVYGNIFDHFAIEYEYPNGARIAYMGNQMDGCTGRCHEHFIGTKGVAHTDWARSYIEGPNAYEYEGSVPDPCLRQHADQVNAIRTGKKLNEGKRVAESSLTAIMGRMSAYTGRALKWDWVVNASKLDLSPPEYKFGPLPMRPVAVPGKSPLV
jgi:predicted dehydrogenase